MSNLGELIWWNLKPGLVEVDKVKGLAEGLGLPLDAIPKKVRLRTQIHRALNELADDGFLRRIIEEKEKSVFVLVGEDIDEAREDAYYQVEDRFTYYKKDSRITCDNPSTQVRLDALLKKYEGCFTKRDICIIVCRMIDSDVINGVAIKSGSGIYFTPASSAAHVDNLSAFVSSVTDEGSLSRMSIQRTKANVEEVKASYLDNFQAEVNRTKEKIAALKEGDKYRKSTMVKELEDLLQFSARSRMYSQMLEIDRKDMNKKIDEVEEMIRSMMIGK